MRISSCFGTRPEIIKFARVATIVLPAHLNPQVRGDLAAE